MNKRVGGGCSERWGGTKKISKESRLSPVISGGIPAWQERREGQMGFIGKIPGFIEKNSVFGMTRKQTIIYID